MTVFGFESKTDMITNKDLKKPIKVRPIKMGQIEN